MNKTIRYIQSYLILSFPLVVICMLWNGTAKDETITKLAQELLSWNLMLWFTVLTLFLLLLVVIPRAREITLRRLANLNERDEREEYITGKAARASYIATLSLMIFLFFSSVFSVTLVKLPPDKAPHGKQHVLSFSVIYNFIEKSRITDPHQYVIFDSRNIAPSKATVIILLIGWQLLVFNWNANKEHRG